MKQCTLSTYGFSKPGRKHYYCASCRVRFSGWDELDTCPFCEHEALIDLMKKHHRRQYYGAFHTPRGERQLTLTAAQGL